MITLIVLNWFRRRHSKPSPEVAELRSMVATQLDLVVEGHVSAEDALRALETAPFELRDSMADDAWHLLVHVRDDADIHARDLRYRDWQLSGLRRSATRLRAEG